MYRIKWVFLIMTLSVLVSMVMATLIMVSGDKVIEFDAKTLKGDAFAFQSVTISPDNMLVAAGQGNGCVKIWERETGIEWMTIPGGKNSSSISDFAFSPNRETLAWGNGNFITLLEVKKKTKVKIEIPGRDPVSLRFSHDGKILAVAQSEAVILFLDLESNKSQVVFDDKEDRRLESLAFHPQKKTLAIGRLGKVVFMDILTTKMLPMEAKGQERLVSNLAFSNDGEFLAGITSRNATVWNANTGTEVTKFSFDGSLGSTTCLAFSQDKNVIGIVISNAKKRSSRIKVWNIKEQRELAEIDCKQDVVTGIAWSVDGKTIATSSRDQTVKLWNVAKLVKK